MTVASARPGVDRLGTLTNAGVSIWLDVLSRDLLATNEFERLIGESHVTGATSNPTIFAAAITGSDRYDEQLGDLKSHGMHEPRELFFTIALDDVRSAADLLIHEYHHTDGRDGYVSFECTPDVARDTEATITQARELWRCLDRPNVMIKVPATAAGVPAIEQLTADGINVNVTLLFSVERYDEVMDAYLAGLERRHDAGQRVDGLASVASFFVSRIDTTVDAVLSSDSSLQGRAAIANARIAYQHFRTTFAGPRWDALRDAGASLQRPLWASTGTKNPEYSDVRYVEELIGPDVINTMPLATLRAFAGHGTVLRTVDSQPATDDQVLRDLRAAGIDFARITTELEHDGVSSFCDAYERLLECVAEKADAAAKRPE